ncbi:MAG: hypothetical protein LBR32_04140 [Propionibacteriaceae bacterium]|jgi:hypothetical protein|nr:hypothetical protein [Propionibacteriaceae bacterium]
MTTTPAEDDNSPTSEIESHLAPAGAVGHRRSGIPEGAADPFLLIGRRIGAASPLFLMGAFSVLWSGIAQSSLQAAWTLAWLIVCLVAAVFFFGVALRTLRDIRMWRTEHADLKPSAASETARRASLRDFSVLFGVQFVLMASLSVALSLAGRPDEIPPSLVIIMGAHFVPFAPLFHRRVDYAIGALAVVIGVLGQFAVITPWCDPALASSLTCVAASVCTLAYGCYFVAQLRREESQLA